MVEGPGRPKASMVQHVTALPMVGERVAEWQERL